MKRAIFAALAVLAAAGSMSISAAEWVIVSAVDEAVQPVDSAQAQQRRRGDIEGTWTARVYEPSRGDTADQAPRLQLQMQIVDDEFERWGNWGQSVRLSAFSNLPSNLDAPQDVKFELRRDAGTIVFEGRFEGGRGVGHLYYTANRDFERAMEQQTRDSFTDRELFSFALMDVSRQFVKELQDLGFGNVTLEDARKARIHGVSGEYIKSMRAAGMPNGSLDDFVKFRIHGVSMDYVNEMRAAGLASDLDDILQMKIHGVTPAYAKEMRSLGGEPLDASDIRQLKIHGVTPAYIKEMRDAGLGNDLSEIRQLKIHGVTAAYAKEMRTLTGEALDAGDIRQMRIHGVTPAYVREMADLGYKNLGSSTLVKFRIHGVTPAFVKELRDAGYKDLSKDELVDWAIHGRRLLKYRRR